MLAQQLMKPEKSMKICGVRSGGGTYVPSMPPNSSNLTFLRGKEKLSKRIRENWKEKSQRFASQVQSLTQHYFQLLLEWLFSS